MKTVKTTIIIALSFLFGISSNAQYFIEWQKCYGGSNSEFHGQLEPTVGGGYIFAGSSLSTDGDVVGSIGSENVWVFKINENGILQWQKTYGGSTSDYAESILQTSDGGYIVVGGTLSNDGDVNNNHGNHDYWVLKLDELGNIEWQRTLGGSDFEVAYAVQLGVDGGYLIAGRTVSEDGDVSNNLGLSDIWLVKLDSSGAVQWDKSLGGSSHESVVKLKRTSDGNYILAGFTKSNNGDALGNHGLEDMWVVKIDVSGSIIWQKCLGGSSHDYANAMQLTSDGGCVVAGKTNSNNGDVSGSHGDDDFWVAKLNNTGEIEWQKCFGGSAQDAAYGIQITNDGGYIATGVTVSNDGDIIGNHGYGDGWVIKMNSSGEIEWQKALGGSFGRPFPQICVNVNFHHVSQRRQRSPKITKNCWRISPQFFMGMVHFRSMFSTAI